MSQEAADAGVPVGMNPFDTATEMQCAGHLELGCMRL